MADRKSTITVQRQPWRRVNPTDYWDLPRVGGCYAFYMDGELVYIGQSRDLRGRLAMHNVRSQYGPGYFTPWGSCESVALKLKFATRYGEWAMREIRLIDRLRPKFNKRRG